MCTLAASARRCPVTLTRKAKRSHHFFALRTVTVAMRPNQQKQLVAIDFADRGRGMSEEAASKIPLRGRCEFPAERSSHFELCHVSS
jgi:hypothetical protein